MVLSAVKRTTVVYTPGGRQPGALCGRAAAAILQ